jgi:hypothetical protein
VPLGRSPVPKIRLGSVLRAPCLLAERESVAPELLPRLGFLRRELGEIGAGAHARSVRVVERVLEEASEEGCGGQGPPVAHLALTADRSQVTVCLSDGRSARKTVKVTEKGMVLTFRDEDMEE